jgi:membrane protease YdiL (CAAX protease family)
MNRSCGWSPRVLVALGANELGRCERELQRMMLRRPHQVPLSQAMLASAALIGWGNGVTFAGRRHHRHRETITTVAHATVAGLSAAALWNRGWTAEDLGIRVPRVASPRPPVAYVGVGTAVVVPLFFNLGWRRGDVELRRSIWRLLVGTTLAEEVLHRGALLALWTASCQQRRCVVAANMLVFGLWHLVGAIEHGRLHPARVLIPAAGTSLFLWARLRSRSLILPWLLHISTNLPGLVVESLSWS